MIYLGGVLPILLYGYPVWVKAMKIESYKSKLIRVQRIININLANDALCILTGMTPIA